MSRRTSKHLTPQQKAERHMSRTKHSVQWHATCWECNQCPAGRLVEQKDDSDTGNYYDNFVDGRGF